MKAEARIRAALSAPSPDIRLYLLHGPDEAGARALAAGLARAMGPDAERIDLEPAMLRSNPGRLADEAAGLSLFGGNRFIQVVGAGEEVLEALTLLLAVERAGNPALVIAPGVRTTSRIVKLALESRRALVHGCYEPTAAEAEHLVIALARDHGLAPERGVARRIADAASGDRAVMAREVEKLALYLDADPARLMPLTDAAIDALGADLGEGELGALVAAVIDGDPAVAGATLANLAQAGSSPIPWLRQLARRLITLADMRAEIDAGTETGVVMKRHRVHFREEAATRAALLRWTAERLVDAVGKVRAAERAVMAPGNPGNVVGEAAAVALARAARR